MKHRIIYKEVPLAGAISDICYAIGKPNLIKPAIIKTTERN